MNETIRLRLLEQGRATAVSAEQAEELKAVVAQLQAEGHAVTLSCEYLDGTHDLKNVSAWHTSTCVVCYQKRQGLQPEAH
jgi:hypothetical protein